MMKNLLRRCFSALCAGVLALSLLPAGALALGGQSDFLKASGHLESAYIEWSPVAGATLYRVYVKPAAAADSAYQQLDDQLVRRYPTYWRADALGLAAGSYVMKVTPVRDGTDLDALVTGPLEVLAQDRSGYGFAGGNVPGAYNKDGTLKKDAKVVYVTDDNKNDVKLGGYTGFQNIVKNADNIGTPVDIRILGKVSGLSNNLVNVQVQDAHLTIEGVGSDATAYGWGFSLKSCSHVELRNLAIMLVSGGDHDGVTVERCQYLWVHNCEFFYNARQDDPEGDKEKGDGSLDTKHSQYASYSYNRFWDAGKCNLQGSKKGDSSNYITYHHNWYDHSDERHPRVREARVHVYNNYYDHNDKYGIGAGHHSNIFAENNYFDGCAYPMVSAGQGNDPGFLTGSPNEGGDDGGVIKACGNIIVGTDKFTPYSENSAAYDAYDVTDRDARVPETVKALRGGEGYDNFDTKSDFYSYEADAAADVPAKVKAYAGRVEGGDFPFDMAELTNGSSDPDPKLMAAIQSYTCKLVSVGGDASGDVVDPSDAAGFLGGLPWKLDGDKVTVTGAIPVGEQVWAACWDSADRFLGVHALDAQNEARLDRTWARFKLLWLNDKEAPKCSAAEVRK